MNFRLAAVAYGEAQHKTLCDMPVNQCTSPFLERERDQGLRELNLRSWLQRKEGVGGHVPDVWCHSRDLGKLICRGACRR